MNSTDRIFYIMGLVLLGGLVMVEILAAAGVADTDRSGIFLFFFVCHRSVLPRLWRHPRCLCSGRRTPVGEFPLSSFCSLHRSFISCFCCLEQSVYGSQQKNRRQEASFFSLPYRLGLYRSGHSSDPVDRKKCPSLCLVYIR